MIKNKNKIIIKGSSYLLILFTILICSCFNKSTPSNIIAPDYSAFRISTAPKIDGEIDDIWKNIPSEPIKKKLQGINYIKDTLDLSAYYKMAWNDNNLYILFDINDDIKFDVSELEYDFEMPPPYECDCIELFLDMKNHKNAFDTAKGDFRYEFVYGRNYITGLFPSKKGIEFAKKDRPGGYLFEIRIPFTTLGIKPTENYTFGCEICVNDNDNDLREGIYSIQRALICWSEEGNKSTAWLNTKVYGHIKLKN